MKVFVPNFSIFFLLKIYIFVNSYEKQKKMGSICYEIFTKTVGIVKYAINNPNFKIIIFI